MSESTPDGSSNPKSTTAEQQTDGEKSEQPPTPTPAGFVSRLAEYQELFKDRYTENDAEYMKRVNARLEPIIVHPWPPKREFQDRQGGGRHWRGGGGNRRRY